MLAFFRLTNARQASPRPFFSDPHGGSAVPGMRAEIPQ